MSRLISFVERALQLYLLNNLVGAVPRAVGIAAVMTVGVGTVCGARMTSKHKVIALCFLAVATAIMVSLEVLSAR